MKPDPIYAAIDAHLRLDKFWCDLSEKLDLAEYKAQKKHGARPCTLVAWRDWLTSGSGIDKARKDFLAQGLDPNMINKEYRDAKRRERAAERAERAWDRRTGIAPLRRECDRAIEAERRAAVRMAKTRPTTPAGVAKMLAFLKADIKDGETHWHEIAFDTLVATLKTWGKAVRI
jgi:hypothetical protein